MNGASVSTNLTNKDLTMKTMRKDGKVIRVSEKEINQRLSEGFNFCPKHVYKNLKQTEKEYH